MSQVIDPKAKIESKIMCSTSLPKDLLIKEIICIAANYYCEFTNDIQPTTNWSWATWIKIENQEPFDVFYEAVFQVAEKNDCLNDINIKSELRKKIKEIETIKQA